MPKVSLGTFEHADSVLYSEACLILMLSGQGSELLISHLNKFNIKINVNGVDQNAN